MKRYIRIILVISVFQCGTVLHAQIGTIRLKEDSLSGLALLLRQAADDSSKIALNDRFSGILSRALVEKSAFDYPFDSLRTVGRLVSPDRKFRLFIWNLPKSDGTNHYFGYILFNPKEKRTKHLVTLTDRSDTIGNPAAAMLDNRSWYGCLYYRIILSTYKGTTYYTLLGWDGFSSQISQKIIDVMLIGDGEEVRFGARIFRNYGADHPARILFRYSASASMFMNYDKQFLTTDKQWNAKKKRFEMKQFETEMIVCDELVPPATQFEGRYEYYIPSSETFHGFVFQDGMWTFYPDVEVRNRKE